MIEQRLECRRQALDQEWDKWDMRREQMEEYEGQLNRREEVIWNEEREVERQWEEVR